MHEVSTSGWRQFGVIVTLYRLWNFSEQQKGKIPSCPTWEKHLRRRREGKEEVEKEGRRLLLAACHLLQQ